ncbi:MAG: TlpA disulfide reductase family protein [Lutibacter sp.]|nr:TlpA disulfide reductase family protein [Lutibacter sp.]MDP3358995.1 TlpA disulfide reductase family protein [Lutibacter sp.]MDP3945736.1 TlpA disulfide reductase family protein [Lutibacter sp.]
MKNYISLTLFISIFLLLGCSDKPKEIQQNINITAISKNFPAWWEYHSNNIVLSSSFIPLDESSNFISKGHFFQSLISGEFIPIKIDKKNATTYYQLFKLDNNSDKDIRSTIKNTSKVVYSHYLMEGEAFSTFNITDLNGDIYNNENTKGKIIILKCWFIHCKACVAEFPELNELVDKYKNREDIIFLSLAFDTEDELKRFLIKKPFNYKVAAVEKSFFDEELKISEYPTHFIIDNEGIIKKVVNTSKELFLEFADKGILNSDNSSTRSVPPPPSALTE